MRFPPPPLSCFGFCRPFRHNNFRVTLRVTLPPPGCRWQVSLARRNGLPEMERERRERHRERQRDRLALKEGERDRQTHRERETICVPDSSILRSCCAVWLSLCVCVCVRVCAGVCVCVREGVCVRADGEWGGGPGGGLVVCGGERLDNKGSAHAPARAVAAQPPG